MKEKVLSNALMDIIDEFLDENKEKDIDLKILYLHRKINKTIFDVTKNMTNLSNERKTKILNLFENILNELNKEVE